MALCDLDLTLKDETGNSNIIITPAFYGKKRLAILGPKFVHVSGTVQSQDGVVHLRAEHIAPWPSAPSQ